MPFPGASEGFSIRPDESGVPPELVAAFEKEVGGLRDHPEAALMFEQGGAIESLFAGFAARTVEGTQALEDAKWLKEVAAADSYGKKMFGEYGLDAGLWITLQPVHQRYSRPVQNRKLNPEIRPAEGIHSNRWELTFPGSEDPSATLIVSVADLESTVAGSRLYEGNSDTGMAIATYTREVPYYRTKAKNPGEKEVETVLEICVGVGDSSIKERPVLAFSSDGRLKTYRTHWQEGSQYAEQLPDGFLEQQRSILGDALTDLLVAGRPLDVEATFKATILNVQENGEFSSPADIIFVENSAPGITA